MKRSRDEHGGSRGGWRQRQCASSGSGDNSIGECALAQYLVTRWAWGWLSPQSVQAIASKDKQDIDAIKQGKDIDYESLDVLANLGNHGQNSNHCNKCLVDSVQGVRISMLVEVQMPIKLNAHDIVVTDAQNIFLPHEVFQIYTINTQLHFVRKFALALRSLGNLGQR